MVSSAQDWEDYFKSFELPVSLESDFSNDLSTNIANEDKLSYFVFDFRTFELNYLSTNFEKVIGHSIESGRRGFQFMQENVHPDDNMRTMIYTQRSHEELMKLPFQQRKGTKLRMNYRLYHPVKGWLMILHQATFQFFSEDGLPVLAVGFMFDVSDYIDFDIKIGVLELVNGEIIELETESTKLQLTKRELEVVLLAKNGMASKNIADTLCISINTVNNIRAKIIKKGNAQNMAEIVARAVKEGLV